MTFRLFYVLLVVSSLLNIHHVLAGQDDFTDCGTLLQSTRCEEISRDNPVFKLCCSNVSDQTLSKVTKTIKSKRTSLLNCVRQKADPHGGTCEQRGCFCGIMDSALPPVCFDNTEPCCNVTGEPDISSVSKATKVNQELDVSLKACQARPGPVISKPPVGGYDDSNTNSLPTAKPAGSTGAAKY